MKETLNILKVLWIVWIWEPIESFWHDILVHLGIRPCCNKPYLETLVDEPMYFSAVCKNCGKTHSGGVWLNP